MQIFLNGKYRYDEVNYSCKKREEPSKFCNAEVYFKIYITPELKAELENIKSDNFPVNLKNNPKGIYFVNTGNKNSSVKIIIE